MFWVLSSFNSGVPVNAMKAALGNAWRIRSWFSPPGRNLYFSFLLNPRRPNREWPELPWVVAGALARVLHSEGLPELTLKTPNDLLVRSRKIAGVLLENRVGAGTPQLVVAGVGLNVNMTEEDFPLEIRGKATSLKIERGRSFDRVALLRKILSEMRETARLWHESGGAELRLRLQKEGIFFLGFEGVEK